MNQISTHEESSARYAKCIEVSKRIRWDIEQDVIRGRRFDLGKKFLPDGLSLIEELPFLAADEKRFLSQVQGRTYAGVFGLVERFICAKVMELGREHVLGDQIAVEALVRFSDEELKHQEMFRRLEALADEQMPKGYVFLPRPSEVANSVLGKSTWAVLALTLHIELFTQAHYRKSIEPDDELSALWKDVFLYHWREESQHAILDELEWQREDEKVSDAERDAAVDEFIELVAAIDGILQQQSAQDAHYFISNCNRIFSADEVESISRALLKAYRWQYIHSGVQMTRFGEVLGSLVTPEQGAKIQAALETLV